MSNGTNPWPKENPQKPSRDLTGVWPTYNQPAVFDWSGVDPAILKALFQVATASGKTIGIGPAMGGRGVVITLYMGLKQNPKRFAITPDELEALMLPLIEAWQSPSEDVLALMRMTFGRGGREAAD